jgi:hypothetical protein
VYTHKRPSAFSNPRDVTLPIPLGDLRKFYTPARKARAVFSISLSMTDTLVRPQDGDRRISFAIAFSQALWACLTIKFPWLALRLEITQIGSAHALVA